MSNFEIDLEEMLTLLPPKLRNRILTKAMSFGAMTWEYRYTIEHEGEIIPFTAPRHYTFENLVVHDGWATLQEEWTTSPSTRWH